MEKKRKKALILVTKSNWGGAQKYVYDLAENLPKEEFDVTVVFGGQGMLAEKLASIGARTISIPRLARDINIFADISSFFTLLSLFKKEKPDIAHVNSSKAGGIGALAARFAGVPRIIFTCHGWPFNEDRNACSLAAIKFFSWFTAMLSHVTITVSERDLHDGMEMLCPRCKMLLVHNGVKSPKLLERVESRQKISGLALQKGVTVGDNDFLVGAIGELHRNKAYEHAIEAIDSLKRQGVPAKFVVFGEGEERKALEKKIKAMQLEKDIALLGFVSEAPSYLASLDAFVLSSLKEGLPYVVIEAGFAALPVVATNVGGVKEIVEDMKSGILVQTRKPMDIAQGLELIYRDPVRGKAFGAALKEKVEKEFSISKMIEGTVEVYKGA